jgi:hypothetical protein
VAISLNTPGYVNDCPNASVSTHESDAPNAGERSVTRFVACGLARSSTSIEAATPAR